MLLAKKLHIFVAFGDYNFFTIGTPLRIEMLTEHHARLESTPTKLRGDFKSA